ncbi:MAG: hypothetical protein KGI64_10225 [Xanthomonadaceae bacterium]|nr:hypothetical protein [Xanthomonadaceae bacterium]
MSTLSNPVRRTETIEGLFWIWLSAGALACLMFAPLRGHDPLLGWLPFWLVAAPLIDLGVLHRHRLAAAAVLLRSSMIARVKKRPSEHVFFGKRGCNRARPCARRFRRDQSLMPRRFLSMRRRNSDMMRRYKSSPR